MPLFPQRGLLFLLYLQTELKFISNTEKATTSRATLNLEDFELYMPEKDYTSLVEHKDLYQWMEDIRKLKPDVPRMCLPSQKAGPDVVFCLQSKEKDPEPTTVVVAIQVFLARLWD